MDNLQQLLNKLSQLITLENERTREEIAGFIVGELIGDYEEKYKDLYEKHPELQRIADLASDLEWSNGNPSELETMWQEMCSLIRNTSAYS